MGSTVYKMFASRLLDTMLTHDTIPVVFVEGKETYVVTNDLVKINVRPKATVGVIVVTEDDIAYVYSPPEHVVATIAHAEKAVLFPGIDLGKCNIETDGVFRCALRVHRIIEAIKNGQIPERPVVKDEIISAVLENYEKIGRWGKKVVDVRRLITG